MQAKVTYTTQHYWRGIGKGRIFGDAPSFEPSVSITKGKVNFGVFAGVSFDNVYKSVIPWGLYSPTKNWSVGVWDIYSGGTNFWHTNFFNFNPQESKHLVDGVVMYRFGAISLKLKWATLFAGGDDDVNGNQNFSSYFEAAYQYKWQQYALDALVGITPWKGLYAHKPGMVNSEIKLQRTFKVHHERVSLPVFIKVNYNDVANKFHFIAGAYILLSL